MQNDPRQKQVAEKKPKGILKKSSIDLTPKHEELDFRGVNFDQKELE